MQHAPTLNTVIMVEKVLQNAKDSVVTVRAEEDAPKAGEP